MGSYLEALSLLLGRCLLFLRPPQKVPRKTHCSRVCACARARGSELLEMWASLTFSSLACYVYKGGGTGEYEKHKLCSCSWSGRTDALAFFRAKRLHFLRMCICSSCQVSPTLSLSRFLPSPHLCGLSERDKADLYGASRLPPASAGQPPHQVVAAAPWRTAPGSPPTC